MRLLILDLFGSVLWFPVWWYTTGLKRVVAASIRAILYRVKEYALIIWIKNFFVPMYGQFDAIGRIVSICMRAMVLLGRGVMLSVVGLIYLLGILAWIVLPPAILILLILNVVRGSFLS